MKAYSVLFSKILLVQFGSNPGICFNIYCIITEKIIKQIKFIHHQTTCLQI